MNEAKDLLEYLVNTLADEGGGTHSKAVKEAFSSSLQWLEEEEEKVVKEFLDEDSPEIFTIQTMDALARQSRDAAVNKERRRRNYISLRFMELEVQGNNIAFEHKATGDFRTWQDLLSEGDLDFLEEVLAAPEVEGRLA